ncbi:hypothetical protein [Kitasatospora sp. SUK 42]|uniref:hypothetical protein n=1 Tax=Kitasatospora sp. SUK 42 TaxID=1588882 RepID=UPI0018CBB6BE|nr:hypothetical protein [Kitasatospora sp. SUK 42]MBV2154030.1 hypothetical protein [Kitasatospora sp. SUK 42]
MPVCSIVTVAEGGTAAAGTTGAPVRQSGACRHDSVPQPRTRGDAEAYLLPATGPSPATGDPADPADLADPTAERLRAAFADRLRAARAEGRSVAELAAACRRSAEEVRALLGEQAGDGSSDGDHPSDGVWPGVVRLQQSSAPAEGSRPSPVLRSAREEVRSYGSRRPSPSRRLRRMHPQADRTGQEAAARETAATDPVGAEPRGTGWAGELTGATGSVSDHLPSATAAVAPGSSVAPGSAVAPGDALAPGDVVRPGDIVEVSRAEPPLGVLIGGSPGQPEVVVGRPEERAPVRSAAEPIRVGRGTSLVVLPSWRPAIAVSVSTEQLLSETGLTVEQLVGARLTVLMNPWALHDRELELHGWEPSPTGRGRRGGRG